MNRNPGQALLLVLLAMAVVLTAALSILSSSVTDIRTTGQEEEALRAFSAAEAGVEKALFVGTSSSGSIGNSNFNTSISTLGLAATNFVYPLEIASGDNATIWFVNHASDDSLTCTAASPCFTGHTFKFCWGKSGTSGASATTPAMEVSFFYATTPGDYSTIRIARAVYDPNAARQATNAFAAPDAGNCTIASSNFAFQKTVDIATMGVPAGSYGVQNGLQMARVRLLYNTDVPQSLGMDTNFAGNSTLPQQGAKVNSTGTSGVSTRRIEVIKTYTDLPSIFDATLFSPVGMTK